MDVSRELYDLIYGDRQSRMTGSSWALIELCKNLIADLGGNVDVILLEEQEMRIALDIHVGKLDPLVVGKAHLLEVFNKAVVVRDVRAGLACDHDVRHFADLGELVDGASLQDAGALGRIV